MRLSDLWGRRLDTVQKVQQELNLPVLVELPLPSLGRAVLEEAYTQLNTEIARQLGQNNGQHRTLAVTSTLPEEGRSSVTAGIALAAARRNSSVLVVDTEVRAPQQHHLFASAVSSPGLIELLAQRVHSPSAVLQETELNQIRLLPVGEVQEEEADSLFGSLRLERFVRQIAPRLADLVVFDAPHVLSKEPGRPILSHVDGVLFVVRLGKTDAARARQALDILEQRQGNVIGIVCLKPGAYALDEAVPLPEKRPRPLAFATNLKNSPKDTETLGNTTSEEETSLSATATPDEEPDGVSMKVSGAQKIDDGRDPEGAQGRTGIGIEDLEAVLQGWRRRDTVAVEPVNTALEVPLPLHTIGNDTPVEAIAPRGIAFPMGSVAPGSAQDNPAGAFLSVTESPAPDAVTNPPSPKPVLTLVGGDNKQKEPAALTSDEKTFEPMVPIIPMMPVASANAKDQTGSGSEAIPAVVPLAGITIPQFAPPEPPAVAAAPAVIVPPPAPVPAPVEPPPAPVVKAEPVPAPVAVVPEPVVAAPPAPAPVPPAAPVVTAPPVYTPAPVAAAATPVAGEPLRAGLDLQVDMFQSAPGEMTMRAMTTNAAAIGYPHLSLELGIIMAAMRGMRVITPSSMGGADQPRIILESIATDLADASRMRLVVGNTQEPALDIAVKNGEALSLRTGTGTDQPQVQIESQNQADGSSVVRAVLTPARGGQELVMELRREPISDGLTEARWRNRLVLMS